MHKIENKTVAVMQPYFFPYAGYFRLIAQTDIFVIFDDVQFPRRGRVHRCEMPSGDERRWLTLPLARCGRETLIKDLQFAKEARSILDERLLPYKFLRNPRTELAERLCAHLYGSLQSPIDFLECGLSLVAHGLKLQTTIIRSSSLNLPSELRAQNRVVAVAQTLGATSYINAPGGRGLYDERIFQAAGLRLSFLPPYFGSPDSILSTLFQGDLLRLRCELLEKSAIQE